MISLKKQNIKAQNGRILLQNFSLSISQNERVALIGPNGSGKSTLLRQIAKIETGKHVAHVDFRKPFRMSYIPTRPLDLILPWFSFERNISFFSSIANVPLETTHDCFYDYMSSINYDTKLFFKRKVYLMSSGQQALLAIFCALIQNPTILIIDEIFSTLSDGVKKRVIKLLSSRKRTILFASHDREIIDVLGTRVVNLMEYINE